ncbi:subunit of both RNase [Coemansia spiralis]|nr:subunit of both RNase [Coemansia spiralis]
MVRFKNRYICFELLDQQHILGSTVSAKNIVALVRDQIKLNFGDMGAGHLLSGLQIKYLGNKTQLGIIKVPRDHCRMVQVALALITHVNKHSCTIRVRHVSGTIKKCQKATIQTNRELIIAWYEKQQQLSKSGEILSKDNSSLLDIIKQSTSQISALDL